MRIIKTSLKFNRAIFKLLKSESFLSLSVFGNSIVLLFALVCYLIENDRGAYINSPMDAIWWAYATATGVGYGDVIPVSTLGKLLGIILMLLGTVLFATFTALFAKTILEDEIFVVSQKDGEDIASDTELLDDLKNHKRIIEEHISKLESK